MPCNQKPGHQKFKAPGHRITYALCTTKRVNLLAWGLTSETVASLLAPGRGTVKEI